ncbi:MAG TPA: helix-turn-helix domain-containing protein [Methylocella sp.]|nr:helix-turn-helix domain-containing protein [Methylocella sp.]
MTRAADHTRKALLGAATDVFAEVGYERGSIRDIVRRAEANQAAVAYHFGGKDGLYKEVLKLVIAAYADSAELTSEKLAEMDGPAALSLFIRHQISTITRRHQFAKYLRILAWENVLRSAAFQEVLETEPLPLFEIANLIVRKFLPTEACAADVTTAIIWLLYQTEPFIRNADRLPKPPINLKVDATLIEALSNNLSRAVAAGLSVWSSKAAGTNHADLASAG